MKRAIFFSIICSLLTVACSDVVTPDSEEQQIEVSTDSINESNLTAGHLRIRINDEFAESLESNTDESGVLTKTSVTRADEVLSGIGVKYLTRTFPYAGRFEPRTRAAGLHLWYDVYFDESQPLTKANSDLGSLDGVLEVEYRPIPVHIASSVSIPVTQSTSSSRSSTMPFNDPYLSSQWHYNNTGSGNNQIMGSDINLFAAWNDGDVGSNSVIVCVVDTGIDIVHEDLAANIWINEAEANGTRGVDDDKNSYTDDVNGYSFVTNGGSVKAGEHGTHVAGTIAAVNNNGVGVGGIAGGNYAKGIAGVQLISAEIFRVSDTDPDTTLTGSGATAIKYGADAGAVISQNSWGYEESTTVSSSDAAAIDYFIANAGFDENGVQVGPMAGGVVVFAAGNESRTVAVPGMYEPVICVTSIGADFKAAYYTNYGDWADIVATGGDYETGNMIVSTTPDNTYSKMQGTSMAAPHISGVAALIVSKYGGMGFTPQDLKDRLYNYGVDINSYQSSAMKGKLGDLVDTYSSLMTLSTIAPNSITTYSTSVSSNVIEASVTVPADSDASNGSAYGITAYYSTSSFTSSLNRDNLPSGVSSTSFLCSDVTAGGVLECEISGLAFETTYYIAFDAYDQSRNKSSLSSISTVTTGSNNPPIIEALDGIDVEVKAYETLKFGFNCYDPDGHSVTLKVVAGSDALTYSSVGDLYTFAIKGSDAPEGEYVATLTLSDQYGASTTLDFNYEILPNNAPEVINDPDDIVMTKVGETLQLDLSTVFYDEDGESLTYTSSSSASTVAHLVPSSNTLYITSMSYGNATITLTATDARGDNVSTEFKILVRDPSVEVDLYPNPVVSTLYVRMGAEYTTQIKIYNSVGGTVYSKSGVVVTPFEPAELDLSALSAGSYTFVMNYDGNEVTRNIVKL